MTLRRTRILALAALLAGVSACSYMPDWMGGPAQPVKRTPGERIDVVVNPSALKADDAAADVAIEVPDQTNIDAWRTVNEAMLTGHVGLTGVTKEQSATIGDGNEFSRAVTSPPVVAGGLVFAMDAAGVVSAHSESDISEVKWTNDDARRKKISDALGGGLAIDSGVLYSTSGVGTLMAIEPETGKTKWQTKVGAPVRGAPAVSGGLVVVLTADNQTLAYDITTGQPRWEHRGIRETAGYFATTAPVISDGIVVAAYTSGEVFALRLETGNVLWSDTLSSGVRTKASAVFAGIDADPIVQDGVVVVTSASGEMQASALLNGRPMWQQRVGAHSTPWSAGNVLYVITDTKDIAAILKRDGAVRWATSMKVVEKQLPHNDITPPLYGPILSANAVLVLDGDGALTSFKPTTGEKIGSFDLTSGVISNPIVANGALYVITKGARLYRYH